jgi:hypothetical protein
METKRMPRSETIRNNPRALSQNGGVQRCYTCKLPEVLSDFSFKKIRKELYFSRSDRGQETGK